MERKQESVNRDGRLGVRICGGGAKGKTQPVCHGVIGASGVGHA